MDPQFELDEEQKKLKSQIFPYLKALTYEILLSKPDNITSFMIDFLAQQGNYTTSGLTLSEKKELEFLRNSVKHYRELESFNKKLDEENQKNSEENTDSESEKEDLMNSSDEEKFEKKLKKLMKKKNSLKYQETQEIVLVQKYTVFSIKEKILSQKKFLKQRNK